MTDMPRLSDLLIGESMIYGGERERERERGLLIMIYPLEFPLMNNYSLFTN